MALARELAADIIVGDITDSGLPAAEFDTVFIQGVLHHVPA
ncbi:MAG: class I SAM-dependent methyltransferase [Actinomycetota bacterium]|nr:class I SAM-dependent methyltransferase [Actinomycetota bacterium]